jgi:hypothetical protein
MEVSGQPRAPCAPPPTPPACRKAPGTHSMGGPGHSGGEKRIPALAGNRTPAVHDAFTSLA